MNRIFLLSKTDYVQSTLAAEQAYSMKLLSTKKWCCSFFGLTLQNVMDILIGTF